MNQGWLQVDVFRLLTGCALLAMSPIASADSLKDSLERQPHTILRSSKSMLSLSHCIGISLSHWGTPLALADEHLIDIYFPGGGLGAGSVTASIRVVDRGAEREVEMRSSKVWISQLKSNVEACL